MKVCVSDNQGSSSQEWLVQGARLATQQGQVRGKKISPASSQRNTSAPPQLQGLSQTQAYPSCMKTLGQAETLIWVGAALWPLLAMKSPATSGCLWVWEHGTLEIPRHQHHV